MLVRATSNAMRVSRSSIRVSIGRRPIGGRPLPCRHGLLRHSTTTAIHSPPSLRGVRHYREGHAIAGRFFSSRARQNWTASQAGVSSCGTVNFRVLLTCPDDKTGCGFACRFRRIRGGERHCRSGSGLACRRESEIRICACRRRTPAREFDDSSTVSTIAISCKPFSQPYMDRQSRRRPPANKSAGFVCPCMVG
jgi:hypothetical protein